MLAKSLISVLILLLSFPLTAGESAWMAMSMAGSMGESMTESDQQTGISQSMEAMHADHKLSAQLSHPQSADSEQAHDHDEADCDEHCMSCSNHCSSTAIVSSTRVYFDPEHLLAGVLCAATFSRADLLFRPPIRA